jgi:uncharacterized protein (DUF2147 family)
MSRASLAACALPAALACAVALGQSAAGPDITGTWLVEDGAARVAVETCGESVCGTIVWLEEPYAETGEEKLDIHNPDERLRGRAVLGLEIFRASKPAKPEGEPWRGTIYDPEIGKTYTCKAELRADGGRLRIRGFVGVSLFGRTTYWTRVQAAPRQEPERTERP